MLKSIIKNMNKYICDLRENGQLWIELLAWRQWNAVVDTWSTYIGYCTLKTFIILVVVSNQHFQLMSK